MPFSGMRIGLVGPLPPPAGGMANQTRQLAELLRSAQACVEVIPVNPPYQPAWIGRVAFLRAVFRLVPYLFALWRAAGKADLMHVMANSGWSWHLFAAPAIWISWIRRTPVIVNYRGGEAREFLEHAQGIVRCSMNRVAALIVPSGFLQEVFATFGMSARIVPNIIDLSRFYPGKSVGGQRIHLVVARNLEPLYDNETALKAFQTVLRQFPQARLTIAGTGPEDSRLRDLSRQLGVSDQVGFVGRLDREAMADLYRRSDVMINPSRADNMPNSLLEAMASGVPVVTTDVGGIPYMVRHEATALLVKPGDYEAMAAAILRLVTDQELRASISSAATAEVRRYTWDNVAPILAAVYRGAIERSAES